MVKMHFKECNLSIWHRVLKSVEIEIKVMNSAIVFGFIPAERTNSEKTGRNEQRLMSEHPSSTTIMLSSSVCPCFTANKL